MAKPRARRLKVFEAQFGFHDSVVAAPSQQAALDAWGVRQNLFAEGSAKLATDEAAIAAALAHPETPLRRAVGSKDPFGLAANLPDNPDAPEKSRARKPTKDTEPEEAPPPPDRSGLDAAESALAKLDARQREEERAFERRLAELEEEADAARRGRRAEARKARAALDEARRAYRAAGGTP